MPSKREPAAVPAPKVPWGTPPLPPANGDQQEQQEQHNQGQQDQGDGNEQLLDDELGSENLEQLADLIDQQSQSQGEQGQERSESDTPTIDAMSKAIVERADGPTQVDRARASFSGKPVRQRSPFAPKPDDYVEDEKPFYEMGDAPDWSEFVKFVRDHGNLVHRVSHPQPKGDCIDTLWKGVPVIAEPECRLQHVQYGWVSWADAQYQ